MVVYCHELEYHVEKLFCYLQGHIKGFNQNMTISSVNSELLIRLQPNMVLVVHHHSIPWKSGYEWLSGYLLNHQIFCYQTWYHDASLWAIVIIIITTRHSSWCIGQQWSFFTPLCHGPASGWCPSCSSSSSFLLPHFFAKLSLVNHASAFCLGSSGLQLCWWSLCPCAAHAHYSVMALCWCCSPYPLAGTVLRGHSWRWFLAKRCDGFSWGFFAKGWQLGKVILGHLPALWSVQEGWQYTALEQLQFSLDALLWWPPDCIQTPNGVPGFALNVLVGTSILSDNAAKIGKGLCAVKGLVIKQDWCWSIHFHGHDLRFSLADLQSYPVTKLAQMPCLLLHVLMHVRKQARLLAESRSSSISKSIHLIPLSWSPVVRCITQSITRLKGLQTWHIPDVCLSWLWLEVQTAASHAAGEVVVEAVYDLDDA